MNPLKDRGRLQDRHRQDPQAGGGRGHEGGGGGGRDGQGQRTGMGFLNILRWFHTTFQPNGGITWTYLSNLSFFVWLKRDMKQTKNV